MTLLAILKPLNQNVAFVAAFLYQLYVSLWFSKQEILPLWKSGKITTELTRVLILSVITFLVYGLAAYAFQIYWASFKNYQVFFSPTFSWDLFKNFLITLVFVAYPEEFFYRGYLQQSDVFLKRGVLGVLYVNLFFACGHFVGDYHPERLLPFFPGLLFSWLVYRSGTLGGAILYHALCNLFSAWFLSGLYWLKL